MPVEPAPCRWALPDPRYASRRAAAGAVADDVVGLGADLEPGTLLAAYRLGLFPMRLHGLRGPLAWWSPDPRGVIPLDGLRVSRSLRRSTRRYDTSVDVAFDAVVAGCAAPGRSGRWITREVRAAYGELHRLGWAHSIEVWSPPSAPGGRVLVGGLYGVAIGGLFAGESMFHTATDASKVALVRLVELLRADEVRPDAPADALPDARPDPAVTGAPGRLLDVQWCTPHLAGLGCVEIARDDFLERLHRVLALPLPAAFAAAAAATDARIDGGDGGDRGDGRRDGARRRIPRGVLRGGR